MVGRACVYMCVCDLCPVALGPLSSRVRGPRQALDSGPDQGLWEAGRKGSIDPPPLAWLPALRHQQETPAPANQPPGLAPGQASGHRPGVRRPVPTTRGARHHLCPRVGVPRGLLIPGSGQKSAPELGMPEFKLGLAAPQLCDLRQPLPVSEIPFPLLRGANNSHFRGCGGDSERQWVWAVSSAPCPG